MTSYRIKRTYFDICFISSSLQLTPKVHTLLSKCHFSSSAAHDNVKMAPGCIAYQHRAVTVRPPPPPSSLRSTCVASESTDLRVLALHRVSWLLESLSPVSSVQLSMDEVEPDRPWNHLDRLRNPTWTVEPYGSGTALPRMLLPSMNGSTNLIRT